MMPVPSLLAVKLRSELEIAFSINLDIDLSKGSITSCWAPEVETRAIWLSAVGVPK